MKTLEEAAIALYMAGRWELPHDRLDPTKNDIDQAKLWEDLRDALDLPEGTATDAGVGK